MNKIIKPFSDLETRFFGFRAKTAKISLKEGNTNNSEFTNSDYAG
jgi:hypothetical protein